jgi:acetate kinase
MKILALNCGSSTLKFQLIEIGSEAAAPGQGRRLAGGIVERIGERAGIDFAVERGERLRQPAAAADHAEATRHVLDWLASTGLLAPRGLEAVGHRVVHGGDLFVEPTLIDDEVLAAVEALTDLAPLHNAPSLSAIRAARALLGRGVPMVATFDTAFHRTLPEVASLYAIPQELADKHRIRRYGFHGLAHRYMTERYAAITSTPLEQVKLVTLQLGNGCSATAVEGGRSVDTSMGFTPLEGLMMGTRSGDVDPSLAGFLARREAADIAEVEGWLNTRSGLVGVSGRSADMRELLEAEARGDARAALAVAMFCYRVRKYVGAYLAALGGANAVVFGGGIGEHAPPVRARVCDGMSWCGLTLDPERNSGTVGSEGRISADDSTVHAYVIPVDEEGIIAHDTLGCLSHRGNERMSR